jgi:hypothetical protein
MAVGAELDPNPFLVSPEGLGIASKIALVHGRRSSHGALAIPKVVISTTSVLHETPGRSGRGGVEQ